MTDKPKNPDNILLLVNTMCTTVVQFVIEVPRGQEHLIEHQILDAKTVEFSQRGLPENIISKQVITEEEALSLCDTVNPYTKSWTNEKKLKAYFNLLPKE